ncbi:hypothetical protein LB505_003443 [Fusarium chuoi]|nr:hypothetical protein LB505_003443 [Fusarium chuoi]
MSTDNKPLGSVVAFEGHVDTISTQLRLLPTSPHILILPSIQNYISNRDLENRLDVRVYVKKIHEATVARYEAAQAFLHGSTAKPSWTTKQMETTTVPSRYSTSWLRME